MKKVSLLLLALMLALVPAAFADIIYDNGGPNQQNGNEMTEWIQTEDFMLASAQTVTDIHFWDVEGAPGYLGSITWWIVGDIGGNPDFNNILGTGVVSPTHTPTGNCLFFGCEYSNDFTINGVALQAGVTYHLALHNGPVTDFTRSEFYWETTNPNGTNTGLECDLSVGACYNNWFNNGQEHAFYLTGGTPTPEPSSLFLLGSGLVGLAATLRKRISR